MLDNWLRTDDLLGGVNERTLLFADFHRILSLAWDGRESPTPENPHRTPPDPVRLAKQMAEDFSCFRTVAKHAGFPPLLMELALIDDASLKRSQQPQDQQVSNIIRGQDLSSYEQPEFVSVLSAYDQFALDDRLLTAWDRATARVVKEDGQSIVGTPQSYDYVYMWDQLQRNQIQNLQTASKTGRCRNILHRQEFYSVSDGITASEKIMIGLPKFYSFGQQTASELKQSSRPPHRPMEIAGRLLTHLLDCIVSEFHEDSKDALAQFERLILLIVPFTRPRFYASVALVEEEQYGVTESQQAGARPGGSLFILCQESNSKVIDNLGHRIRDLALGIWWLMFQCAMFEARRERDHTRDEDLGQYGHMVAKPLRRIIWHTTQAQIQAEQEPKVPVSLKTELSLTELAAQRFEEFTKIARDALLIKSGRAAPRTFSDMLDAAGFEIDLRTHFIKALEFTKQLGIESPIRRAAVANIEFDWTFNLPPGSRVRTDTYYLESLIGEIVKNAVEYGGYGPQNGNNFVVKIFHQSKQPSDTYVIAQVANPTLDRRASEVLKNKFARGRFYLGLSQIELLAQTYGLPIPHFMVQGTNAIVNCVVGALVHHRK